MLQALGNQFGLGNAPTQTSGLANLLSGGLKCSQNEQRLQAEKSQRNLLKKYLTQATGDPIQSALISNNVQGKGYGESLDVGLGTRASIMQSLGLAQPTQSPNLLGSLTGLGQPTFASPGLLGNMGSMLQPTQSPNLLGSLTGLGQPTTTTPGLLGNIGTMANLANTINQGTGLVNSLGGLGGNSNTLSTLGTLGSIASLGQSKNANPGLLSSLVGLASTPNNSGNIMSSLGGLGSGLLGSNTGNTGGILGNIQSGINTLNTINKVNNAVNSVEGLFA